MRWVLRMADRHCLFSAVWIRRCSCWPRGVGSARPLRTAEATAAVVRAWRFSAEMAAVVLTRRLALPASGPAHPEAAGDGPPLAGAPVGAIDATVPEHFALSVRLAARRGARLQQCFRRNVAARGRRREVRQVGAVCELWSLTPYLGLPRTAEQHHRHPHRGAPLLFYSVAI